MQYFNPLNHILYSPSVGLTLGQRFSHSMSPASGCFPYDYRLETRSSEHFADGGCLLPTVDGLYPF